MLHFIVVSYCSTNAFCAEHDCDEFVFFADVRLGANCPDCVVRFKVEMVMKALGVRNGQEVDNLLA